MLETLNHKRSEPQRAIAAGVGEHTRRKSPAREHRAPSGTKAMAEVSHTKGSWGPMLANLGQAALDLLFPPTCVFCGHGLEQAQPVMLCEACRRALDTAPGGACPRCGRSRPPEVGDTPRCGHCRSRSFAFSGVVALGEYRGGLREAVIAAKQATHEPLAMAVGRLLAGAAIGRWGEQPPDVVTCVPSHPWRRLRRGTHASRTLAVVVARAFGIPQIDLLRCTRRTEKQGILSGAERRRNVRGAFRVTRGYAFPASRVLLIDDVMTTGWTVQSAARELRRAGAAEVLVAVAARGIGTID